MRFFREVVKASKRGLENHSGKAAALLFSAPYISIGVGISRSKEQSELSPSEAKEREEAMRASLQSW